MRPLRAYLILAALVVFVAYFGAYGFYALLVDSIGKVWAWAGAVLIGLGALVILAVGITIIRSQPPGADGREPSGDGLDRPDR